MRITRGTAALLALAGSCAAVAACGGESAGAKGPQAAQAAVRLPLEVWDYTLPNGLRVILDEDKSAPVVAVHVRYKVGGKDDPPGRTGIAHLFEHLMFQGTHSITGNVIPVLQEAGASNVNATTDSDSTDYHETVPKGAIEWALWFEAERMATMRERLDQATFDRERSVVKNELRQRYENRAGGFFFAIRRRALYGADHPYGHAAIGSLEDLDHATLDELHAFHKLFYSPSNAVVSLVGDFDHAQAKAWVERYFGPIPKASAQPVRTAPAPVLDGERRILIEANVEHPSVTVTYLAPPDGAPDLPALSVMLGGIAGNVDWYLAENRSVARGAFSTFDVGMLGSTAEITVRLTKDGDPEEALRVLDKEIFDAKPGHFGAVNGTINGKTLNEVLDFEPFPQRAEQYAHDDDVTRNPLFLAKRLSALQSIDRADVFAARQRYLQTKNRLVSIVRTSASAPLGGRLVGGAR